ncbi:MAG: bifunctional DNA primase/polymerase [Bacteroidales bacterium]|nr:bifunctional DNA primase/polymerase [Candidatus Latescibacterota bacterium]
MNENTIEKNPMLQAALRALESNLHPVPVEKNGEYSLVPWEKYRTTRPTREEVIEWFSGQQDAILGIITGTFFGIMAIELERGHDPWPPPGCELISSCVVETPDGTLQYYYMSGSGIKTCYGEIARGVNVLEKGGYIIIPPSHVNGNPYRYRKGSIEVAGYIPPYWLDEKLKMIRKKQGRKVIFDSNGARIMRKKRRKKKSLDYPKYFENPLFKRPENG